MLFRSRSADWIKTEYINQSSPATFYILGSESSVFSKAKANTAGIPDIQPNADGKLTGVSIYPNPVTDNFTLQINNKFAGKVNVQLIDANGKIRRQLEFTKTAGLMQTVVNADGLPTGIYFVKLFAGEWSNVIKVVKN